MHHQLEHEAVHLCFRQRIGAVLLNRVLGCRTKNGSFIFLETPMTVTVCSCMASSSADCVFGVARLISSAENQVGKNRTGLKAENGIALLILGDDVGTRHVGGHRSRVN